MDKQIIIDSQELIKSSACRYINEDEKLMGDVEETFDDILSLENEIDEVKSYLLGLSKALSNDNKQKCVENIAMLRAMFMNVEGAYSNAADLMSDIAIKIRGI